jgi:hypothetical protein
MISLALGALGGVAIVAAAILLMGIGPRYRVGRLLAAAPAATLDEAVASADGNPRYVRIHGRISSDEEFPDEHDRPLVYRRRRVEVDTGRGWRVLAEEREAVPFGVEERGTFITVAADDLAEGLVVIPREAEGRAADLPPDLAADLNLATPSRLVVEQVSAVEHAFVAGVPRRSGDGTVIGPGLGRPLILTTLELGAAMRVLARGHRRRILAATVLLPIGGALVLVALIAFLLGVN